MSDPTNGGRASLLQFVFDNFYVRITRSGISLSWNFFFFEKIFFTVSGVGQKLKSESFLLKIPEPLLLPACSMAALGPDPFPDEKTAPEELAANWSPAATSVPADVPAAAAVRFTEAALLLPFAFATRRVISEPPFPLLCQVL
jgi:hypothetical protein